MLVTWKEHVAPLAAVTSAPSPRKVSVTEKRSPPSVFATAENLEPLIGKEVGVKFTGFLGTDKWVLLKVVKTEKGFFFMRPRARTQGWPAIGREIELP